ncbi:gamma-glutamyl phosphate reductase [Prevotella herbatica]|uniref:Gamma-glutamyl phosphate reductase n=1 Tax=Prevotella herbatica TaxID=2801997 RepID=A0ABM7NYQ5_9BACT|nr:glutamate-5-semialdehyde dehydrogenase [Prevotella herbatica]BCS85537.1 gamma-glutamyl phosphate reductase [Prevotella herbatica]
MELTNTFKRVKEASKTLATISDEKRNDILLAVADGIENNIPQLIADNALDLARMDKDDSMYDRLQLNEIRLHDIAADMRHVSTLPSPLEKILKEKTLDNGLHLRRISVPFGVIGMIYEARPNVTFDVFSLCFKSGNACILKGSKDADESNKAAIRIIHEVLRKFNINTSVVELLPATHEATAEMLTAVGYIDLCIPRGSKRLINFVRDTAKIPVIETGAGVVHCYFDESGDVGIAKDIINNAKCRRCSVCNSLDTLIINSNRLNYLPEICSKLAENKVLIHADEKAFNALIGHYPESLLKEINEDIWDTEWLSMQMGIKTVDSLDEAIQHISKYGSGHSECIISEDTEAQHKFQTLVDAACVYINVPTSFTDGSQFGLGAEIGISTQKLGARGPMALEEITTYKWIIEGHGQIRS